MDAGAGRSAIKTVAGIILANLVCQGVVLGIGLARHVNLLTALRLSLATGLMFYGAVAAWAAVRSQLLGVEPRWRVGDRGEAIATGVLIGAVGSILVTVVGSAAAHHLKVDPMAGMLGSSSIPLLILGAVLLAGIGPFVEEYVFRGFLLEALRPRGEGVAIVVSAVAFSIAHLRFAQFQYYALMGVVFALIYCKRGLVGSVSAHAAFNGTLVLVAVFANYGPATTFHHDGIAIRLPASWHELTSSSSPRFVASGPGGAAVSVEHDAKPAGFSEAALVAHLQSESTVDASSVQTVTLPAGPAVQFHGTLNGHEHDVTLIDTSGGLVGIDLAPDGSSRARVDVEAALRTIEVGP